MAASQKDNGSKQHNTNIHPKVQQAKPALAHRFPMIFLSARPANNVLPASLSSSLLSSSPSTPSPCNSRPNVVRKLSSMQPQRVPPDAVFASIPTATSQSSSSSNSVSNCGTFTKTVSFGGKQAITIPVPATSELNSVARPASGNAGNETLYSLGTGTMLCFSKLASQAAVRELKIAKPSDAKNGERKASQLFARPIAVGDSLPSKMTNASVASVGASKSASVHGLQRYNTAPGWRRIIRNKAVVYVSPSNTVLHNFEQVKEYLFSAGTCKCGLPCPFHPEQFFQFDTEVPNSIMDTKGNQSKSCSHSKLLSAATEGSKRVHLDTAVRRKGLSQNTLIDRKSASDNGAYGKTDTSMMLKTPPWRKPGPAAMCTTTASNSPTSVTNVFTIGSNAARSSKPSKLVYNLADPNSSTSANARKVRVCDAPRKMIPLAPVPTVSHGTFAAERRTTEDMNVLKPLEEKKPTFRDDPTGYLNQQTAILHSSISILHSPERCSPVSAVNEVPTVLGTASRTESLHANKPTDACSNSSKAIVDELKNEERPIRRHRIVNRIMPMLRTQHQPAPEALTQSKSRISSGVVGVKVSNCAASDLPTVGWGQSLQQTVLSARLAPSELNKSTIINAKSLAGRPKLKEQCSSPKVAKLNVATVGTASGSGIYQHLFSTSTAPTPVAPASHPPGVTTSTTVLVPAHSSHSLINSAGAQIVVIDGLQHSAVSHAGGTDVGRVKLNSIYSGRQQQPAVSICNSLVRTKTMSSAAATPTTATSTLPAMILNGGNIIHLANGLASSSSAQVLSTIGGLLAGETASIVAGRHTTSHAFTATAPGTKSLLTIANEATGTALGFATGSTITMITPTLTTTTSTSLKTTTTTTNAALANSAPHFTTSSFCAPAPVASFTKSVLPLGTAQNVAGNTTGQYNQYAVPAAPSQNSAKAKRHKGSNGFRSIAPVLTSHGSTRGSNSSSSDSRSSSGSLVIPATPIAIGCQPQQTLQMPSSTPAVQLQGPFVQIATPYGGLQNVPFSPRLSGITVVPVSKAVEQPGAQQVVVPLIAKNGGNLQATQQPHHQQQQQQGRQPAPPPQTYNLLGQTIFLPTGNMVISSNVATSAATLLQIQSSTSMAAAGRSPSLLMEQAGVVVRTAKPATTGGFLSTGAHQPSFQLVNTNGGGSGRSGNEANGSRHAVNNASSSQRPVTLAARSAILSAGAGTTLGVVAAQPLATMSPSQPVTVSQSNVLRAAANGVAKSSSSSNSNGSGDSSSEPCGAPSPAPVKPPASSYSSPTIKLIEVKSAPRASILLHRDTTATGQPTRPDGIQRELKLSRAGRASRKTTVGELHSMDCPMPMVQCISSSKPDVPTVAATPSEPLLTPYYERETKICRVVAKQECPPEGARKLAADGREISGESAPDHLQRARASHPVPAAQPHVGTGRVETSGCVPIACESSRPAGHLLTKLPEHPYEKKGPKSAGSCRKRRSVPPAKATSVSDVTGEQCDEPGAPVATPLRAGDLVWGPVRGFPAWPGKVVPAPAPSATSPFTATTSQQHRECRSASPSKDDDEYVWVRWFGTGRTHAARVAAGTLQSLSDGLEAHHRAQKDARKSRKLNAQLEHAIQQAMQELDSTGSAQKRTRRRGPAINGRRRVPQHPPSSRRPARASVACRAAGGPVRYLRGSKGKIKPGTD